MAKKGKFWSKLFKEKDENETAAEPSKTDMGEVDTDTENGPDSELKVEEIPSESCRFCYDPFKSGEKGYQCPKCNTIYHYPNCLKNQINCRVCGEKIIEKGHVVKLIKFRNVVCPRCGMKIKLFYGTEAKLHISCPSCGHEGHLPNPYINGKDTDAGTVEQADENEIEGEGEEEEEEYEFDESDVEYDEDEGEYEGEDEDEAGEEELDFEISEDSEEIDIDLEAVAEADVDDLEAEIEVGGPKIIKPDKSAGKKRKAKLVVLEQSITCNVCLGTVKTGLPVVVCRCGKKYHESCAERVNECPTCDANIKEIERLVEEKPEIEMSDEDLAAFSEPEPEPEPQLELEPKINPEMTFDNFELNEQNKIIHSIAQGIANAPAKEFKLVFIYGISGLGKSHLLHAIGNYIQNNDADKNVQYSTTLDFFSELERALDIGKHKEFEEYYNEADVFLLDDLHEIPKKKALLDKFFDIFDSLIDNNKQIIITADRNIEEIKAINKNLAKKILEKTGIIINLFESNLEA